MTRRGAAVSERLPDRRPHFVSRLDWGGACWLIGVGLDDQGRAAEVFADLADTEVTVEPLVLHLVHEASIVASHLLQHGGDAEAEAERLDCHSPGLLCLMLRRAVEVATVEGPPVRQLALWLAERVATGRVQAKEYAE